NNRLANTKERDFSIGLDDQGFRYYDPEIGRYTTRDPIGYPSGTMNVYESVFNNPVNHLDPLGLGPGDADPPKSISEWLLDVMVDAGNAINAWLESESAPKTAERAWAVAEVAGAIASEPVDKVLDARDIYLNPKDPANYLGLIPFDKVFKGLKRWFGAGEAAVEAGQGSRRALKEGGQETSDAVRRNSRKQLGEGGADASKRRPKPEYGKDVGEYSDVGGHHAHQKAIFKGNVKYSQSKGFSISQDYMKKRGWDHRAMTKKQRELQDELFKSGRKNTLEEQTRIGYEALIQLADTRPTTRVSARCCIDGIRCSGRNST
ncbi:RHS repeat-associated core domain-containing protein, partial [Candidatus Bipolaricaulota bacterium]|nr:RHS repeat-associated core domain-containing protein [Candidatus Bipolaricaulota bacterium]